MGFLEKDENGKLILGNKKKESKPEAPKQPVIEPIPEPVQVPETIPEEQVFEDDMRNFNIHVLTPAQIFSMSVVGVGALEDAMLNISNVLSDNNVTILNLNGPEGFFIMKDKIIAYYFREVQ